MGFQDVAFLPSRDSSTPHFSKRGESLGNTTYPKTVDGGKQGHAPPCKIVWMGVNKGMLLPLK